MRARVRECAGGWKRSAVQRLVPVPAAVRPSVRGSQPGQNFPSRDSCRGSSACSPSSPTRIAARSTALCRRLLACGPVLVQMCAGPGADVRRSWCRCGPVLVQMWAGPSGWCRCAPVPGVDARCGCIWQRTRRVCGTAVPRVKAAALASLVPMCSRVTFGGRSCADVGHCVQLLALLPRAQLVDLLHGQSQPAAQLRSRLQQVCL